MRIISGTAKGRTLYAPQGDSTRPTSDKIRGSLFNILYGRIEDASVLDLFGGTGAMGLEAFSRGAAFVFICDSDRKAIECIRRNAELVVPDEDKARVKIIRSDYAQALLSLDKKFDVVFIDPPYKMVGYYFKAIELLFERNLLSDNAVIICERKKETAVKYPEGVVINDTREYGDTAVDIISRSGIAE